MVTAGWRRGASAVLHATTWPGSPPLGPGAPPLDRLIAYGRARTGFLIEHCDIARAALDGHQPIPARSQSPLSQVHIRMLLGQLDLGCADLDTLATQLTAALDGPLLLYLSASDLTDAAPLRFKQESRDSSGTVEAGSTAGGAA